MTRSKPLVRTLAALVFTFCAFLSTPVQAQLPADLTAQIDKLVTDTLSRTGVPSASVAVVKDGKIAYVKTYGDAKLDPKTPATTADALQHRLDQQTVYGRGHSAFAGAGEAFARRQSREVHSRSDACK